MSAPSSTQPRRMVRWSSVNLGRGALGLFAGAALASCAVSFDVGPRPDAGPSSDADGGSKTCPAATADYFCANFETDPFDTGWDKTNETNGGTVMLDSTNGAQSSSRSAAVHVPSAATSQSFATLVKHFDGVRPLTLEFDALLTTPDWSGSGGNVALVSIDLTASSASDAPRASFILYVETKDVILTTEIPKLDETSWASPFPYSGGWAHVVMIVDWNKRTASVALNGATIITKNFDPTAQLGNSPTTSVSVGLLGFNPPPPKIDVNIDNVVMTLQ